MKNETNVKNLLKQKGYQSFKTIDNSKRQFKQMKYSRGEIQDTLIGMFGSEDPKILQKIKESINESNHLQTLQNFQNYQEHNKNLLMNYLDLQNHIRYLQRI